MKCTNCGNSNPIGSNFCQKCGSKLTDQKNNQITDTPVKENKSKNLWDKFIELYWSKDPVRQKYLDLMSDNAWILIENMSINTFEKYIEDHRDQLNKQPFRLIEQIKEIFLWCISGGYWMWFTEAEFNNKPIKRLNSFELETLKQEWKKLSVDEYSKTYEELSIQLKELIALYSKWRVDQLLENDSIKDLTNEAIEKLKNALSFNIIWGYTIALAESKFRK